MKVIEARNAHAALPQALALLHIEGELRGSRNGGALVYPGPVSTVYQNPCERVVFYPERDYNVAFVLYEALWMLAGRNDLAPLTRYVRDFGRYSDDGRTLHGTYGYRWRRWFDCEDQLEVIVRRLQKDPEDRRCVLQMWDAESDLDSDSKDVPCNAMATLQRGSKGELDLVVFCRSNDTLWGAYYANAFHFGFLLEYMAARIGCPVGTYTQVSVNFHGYVETLKTVEKLGVCNPYGTTQVSNVPLTGDLDNTIADLLSEADSEEFYVNHKESWAVVAQAVLEAHHIWRTRLAPQRFELALEVLRCGLNVDWVVSMREWVTRRFNKWKIAQAEGETP